MLAGKCLPYILFGLIDVRAILLLGNLIFDIGILIATLSSSQQQAMLGAFAFMLPPTLLSGFMSPISTMPPWLRPFTMPAHRVFAICETHRVALAERPPPDSATARS